MNILLSGGLDELIELLISGMIVFIFSVLSFVKLQRFLAFWAECFAVYSNELCDFTQIIASLSH